MSSTVDERREKIQTINAGIAGVKTAPLRMPDNIRASALPCAVTYPGPAVHNLAARGYRREERRYIVRLYVQAYATGKDTHQGFSACLPFLERFPETYLADGVIAPSDGKWEQLTFAPGGGDGGVGIIPLHGVRGGPLFFGIVWELSVIYKETL